MEKVELRMWLSRSLETNRYYTDFLVFYQNEIEEKGWQAVLNEYLFKGDERSDDMLVRIFAGELPLQHISFGLDAVNAGIQIFI